MKIAYDAVCTWGDGPDVLLTIKIDEKPAYFDLTIEEAENLAARLTQAIVYAKQLDEGYMLAMQEK